MPKEPLTVEEQRILIEAAREMGPFHYTPGSKPIDAERTVLFLLDTGIHPSALARPSAALRVERRGEKAWIAWNRPKKRGGAALTRVPASKRIEPWAEEFIAQDRPRFRQLYNALLNALADRIAAKGEWRGLEKHNLTPVALRHTFGVNLISQKVPDRTVQQLMNCSDATLKFYAKYREEMIETELERIGW